MKKSTLLALVAVMSYIDPSSVTAQNAAHYDHLSELEAYEQSYFINPSTFLGEGNFKAAFLIPKPALVIKTCINQGNTPLSCLYEMQAQIQDYNVLERDFRGQLVNFYPTDHSRVNPFVCAQHDAENPSKDCHFILEEFLYGTWKSLHADFQPLELSDVCQWSYLTDEATFAYELKKAMEPLFNDGGYTKLTGSVNGSSIASLSSTLARVSYAFEDLQGSFTSNGFIISDTGVDTGDNYKEDRNCQVNWLCALAKELDADASCSFIRQNE
ncbi:hypothetical protein PsAD46_03731 [Pseudovibrio sp. Ad46]|uniref:hypothetical protein n=1 Tax=unclassified Pseudovibrio TaxID=2627060 RepID=UPI00071114C7|nr:MULTISPECIES: hypothetical protein [unclassified Pseudovibrio]KZK81598.1 hypothetical protein PsAD46_03731 [Pseudovibrio sp. Ad46]